MSIVGFALIYLLLREKGDRIPGFPNANEMSFWGSWVAVDEEKSPDIERKGIVKAHFIRFDILFDTSSVSCGDTFSHWRR